MSWRWPRVVAGVLLRWRCAREGGPEELALQYARAPCARDAAEPSRLLAAAARWLTGEGTFRRQRPAAQGLALRVGRQLGAFIERETPPVETTVRGIGRRSTSGSDDRTRTCRRSRRHHDWDEPRLEGLYEAVRDRIARPLAVLHRAQRLPVIGSRGRVRDTDPRDRIA